MSEGLVKARLMYEKPSGSDGEIVCMFNPNELSFDRSNQYTDRGTNAGLEAPPQTFTGESAGSFSVSLVFDTTDTGKPVNELTSKIVDLMDIDKFGSEERPPIVYLMWGAEITTYEAVIEKTSVSYIYFGADGTPLRANVGIDFKQAYGFMNKWGKQNPTSGTPEPHTRHRVQLGETLDRLAAQYYGDATKWRAIADVNGIADPLAIRPGRVLTIPTL